MSSDLNSELKKLLTLYETLAKSLEGSPVAQKKKLLKKNIDSKKTKTVVRDAEDQVKPVYHGSIYGFKDFDIKRSGRNNYGPGFYFAEDPDDAKGYTKPHSWQVNLDGSFTEDIDMDKYAPNTRKVFLNIKNPFDVHNYEHARVLADALGVEHPEDIYSPSEDSEEFETDHYDAIMDSYNYDMKEKNPNHKHLPWEKVTNILNKKLKELGFDGIVNRNRKNWVVFDNNQIAYPHDKKTHKNMYKSQDTDLEKGIAKRLFPFDPNEVDMRERELTEGWVSDHYSSDRDNVPKLSGNALKRALHKLHSSTKTRRNPETGEREFLLHRGKTVADYAHGLGNMGDRSSFTPDKNIALDFVFDAKRILQDSFGDYANFRRMVNTDEYDDDMIRHSIDFDAAESTEEKNRYIDRHFSNIYSGWVPESAIHHIPKQIGTNKPRYGNRLGDKTIGPIQYRDEYEVLVDFDKIKDLKEMSLREFASHNDSNDVNSRINQRSNLKKGRDGDWEKIGAEKLGTQNRGSQNKDRYIATSDQSLKKSIPSGYIVFYSDGDNVGSQVEKATLTDNLVAVKEIAGRINLMGDILEAHVIQLGGEVINRGGDDFLAIIPVNSLPLLEDARKEITAKTGFTNTIGSGETPTRAAKALIWGKLNGKDMISIWTPDKEAELKQLVTERTPEDKAVDLLGGQ